MQNKPKLSELLLNYERALTDYGLSFASRLRLLHRASRIIQIHEDEGAEYFTDSIVQKFVADFTERYNIGAMNRHSYYGRLKEIERFIDYANTGAISLPYPLKGSRNEPSAVFSQIADEFIATIPHPNTRNDVRWVSHKYFVWLEEQGHIDLSGTGAAEVRKFLSYCSNKFALNSMHNIRLYMAKLYEFLKERGYSESDYNTLFKFAINREAKIYPALPRDDIAKLLDSIDRRTKIGKRDYAIMLLGTVLGLRACDITALKRTDIDWQKGEIKIMQAKTANPVVLPLTKDVGEALKDYIFKARPDTTEPRIFLRIAAPHTPLKAAVTLGEIYAKCCVKAGLPVNKRFHNLRRSLATSMVTNGVSVYDVAQELGDRDINSVKPYIGLDVAHLKICALPFDGIKPVRKISVEGVLL